MKQQKYIAILVLFLVVSIIEAQTVGPKIYSLEKQFDFGQIVEGSIVTHDFEIINNGDAELHLIKVASSCGCTVAKPSVEKLMPGESSMIRVTFNSANRSGPQKKYINVFTNDRQNTRYRLSITATVVSKEDKDAKPEDAAKIIVEETQHDFGTVEEGTVVTLNLGIKSAGKKPLIITDVQKSCGCTATLLSKDKLEPGESGNIKIDLNTSRMIGHKTRTIAIKSNDPYNHRVVVTLFVNVIKKSK